MTIEEFKTPYILCAELYQVQQRIFVPVFKKSFIITFSDIRYFYPVPK